MKKLILPVIAFTFAFVGCQKEDVSSKANLKTEVGSAAFKSTVNDEFYDPTHGQTPINIEVGKTLQYKSNDPIFHYTAFDGIAKSAKTTYTADEEGNPIEPFNEYNLKISVPGNTLGTTPTGPSIGNDDVYITVNGEKYYLLQYHFHYDSEHELNGKRFDMEVHLVHQAQSGKVAVVGVFIQKGQFKNQTLEEIFNAAPEHEADVTSKTIENFDPSTLLPLNQNRYFTYSGSLTTPVTGLNTVAPYTEGLRWFVFEQATKVSEESYKHYTEVYEKPNARPIQPVGDRQVLAHTASK